MMFGVEAPRFATLLTEEVGTDKDRAKIVSFQRLCLLNRDLLIPYYNDYAEKLDLTCKFDSGRASQPSMKKKMIENAWEMAYTAGEEQLQMELTTLTFNFVQELADFSCELSVLDRVWNLLFPDEREKWQHLHVNKYQNRFYITHVNGESGGLKVESKKVLRAIDPMSGVSPRWDQNHDHLDKTWTPLIMFAHKWMKVIRKDWITANKRIQVEYPLQNRYGIAPHAVIRASLSDIYRLDRDLGKIRTRKLVRLVENGFFLREENTEVATMTANDYFEYCRIAYIAGKRKEDIIDPSLSGREMYSRYADGRHEGLLYIDPDSAQEFADWIDGTHPKRSQGGHPWEIKRGGNTTHIDLSVMRPSLHRRAGFKVELRGESIARIAETIRMFLSIHEAGLPISIANPEGVRKRLLAQDNIGIIPSYASLHRANQHFGRDEEVFDLMHYDNFGRFKRRIAPFIRWEPLPILKPTDI